MKVNRIDFGRYMTGIEETTNACRNNNVSIGGERYLVYYTMVELFTDINVDDFDVDELMEMIYKKNIIDTILKEKQAKDFYEDVMRSIDYMHNESKFDELVTNVMDGDDTTIRELAKKLYAEEEVL